MKEKTIFLLLCDVLCPQRKIISSTANFCCDVRQWIIHPPSKSIIKMRINIVFYGDDERRRCIINWLIIHYRLWVKFYDQLELRRRKRRKKKKNKKISSILLLLIKFIIKLFFSSSNFMRIELNIVDNNKNIHIIRFYACDNVWLTGSLLIHWLDEMSEFVDSLFAAGSRRVVQIRRCQTSQLTTDDKVIEKQLSWK